MSQTEVANLLLILGGLVALRCNILAVFAVSLGVIVAARGILRDDTLAGIVVQTVISLILFQVSYLFTHTALEMARRLRATLRARRLPRDGGG